MASVSARANRSHGTSTLTAWHYPPEGFRVRLQSMNIESVETEARLADEARRRGISVDALLTRFIDERMALTRPVHSQPSLPLWHLGSIDALHRRDIYDDVR